MDDRGVDRIPQSQPRFERSWPSFPIPGTTARSWYLADHGELRDGAPGQPGADSFTWDAGARPLTNFHGDTGAGNGGLWTATPDYEWTQNPPGTAVAYVTSPLGGDTTVIGAGAVEAWVRSSTPNVDLQATVTEVRPDGKETFVQGGWVRADERKLDPDKSTPLEPVLSLRASDVEPMPPEEAHKVLTPAQKELFRRWVAEGAVYEAHWSYAPLAKPAVPAPAAGGAD